MQNLRFFGSGPDFEPAVYAVGQTLYDKNGIPRTATAADAAASERLHTAWKKRQAAHKARVTSAAATTLEQPKVKRSAKASKREVPKIVAVDAEKGDALAPLKTAVVKLKTRAAARMAALRARLKSENVMGAFALLAGVNPYSPVASVADAAAVPVPAKPVVTELPALTRAAVFIPRLTGQFDKNSAMAFMGALEKRLNFVLRYPSFMFNTVRFYQKAGLSLGKSLLAADTDSEEFAEWYKASTVRTAEDEAARQPVETYDHVLARFERHREKYRLSDLQGKTTKAAEPTAQQTTKKRTPHKPWLNLGLGFGQGAISVTTPKVRKHTLLGAAKVFAASLSAIGFLGMAPAPTAEHTAAPADRADVVPAADLAAAVNLRAVPMMDGIQSLLETFDGARAENERLLNAGPHSASDFGFRIHPILGYRIFHDGLDQDGATGDVVRATASGRIRYYYQSAQGSQPIETPEELAQIEVLANTRGALRGYGLYAVIEFDGPLEGMAMKMAHLSRGNPDLIASGGIVEAGTDIGAVGFSGGVRAGPGGDGSHMHVETLMQIDNTSNWTRLYTVDGRTYAPFDPLIIIRNTQINPDGTASLDLAAVRIAAQDNIEVSMPQRQGSRVVAGARRQIEQPAAGVEDGVVSTDDPAPVENEGLLDEIPFEATVQSPAVVGAAPEGLGSGGIIAVAETLGDAGAGALPSGVGAPLNLRPPETVTPVAFGAGAPVVSPERPASSAQADAVEHGPQIF